MKLYIFSLFLFLSNSLFAQGCLSGGITFSSQAQIDNFPANYPGCTTIIGNVDIHEFNAGDITNIDSLTQIQQINGNCQISNNLQLSDLSGFNHLTSVGMTFVIIRNPQLADLQGLEGVTSVKDLYIDHNDNMVSLRGLDNLQTISGRLYIGRNPLLPNLIGLDQLQSVGDYMWIERNPQLLHLSGLDNLMSVHDGLIIQNNDALIDLAGLGSLTSVGELDVSYNPNIVNLNGLESLTNIDANLYIQGNNNLQQITALSHLTLVREYVDISFNLQLISLSGLDNLESVPFFTLLIRDNDSLTDLTGLGSLASIDYLLIENNLNLINVNGLSSLNSIDDALIIQSNNSLQEISGLGNLTTLGQSLTIENNPALTDISGLVNGSAQNLTSLKIRGNSNLSNCAITPICTYLLADPSNGAFISNNANNCNSRAEIETACNALLPLQWVNPLSVKRVRLGALLNWSVARQIDNEKFLIEHSTDGKNFKTVGQVSGEPNMESEKSYSFYHPTPSAGIQYYRVRQIDRDGSFSYSGTVSLFYRERTELNPYPNPVSGTLYLPDTVLPGTTIRIFNSTGQMVFTKVWNDTHGIDFAGFPEGIYWLTMQDGATFHYFRIMHDSK